MVEEKQRAASQRRCDGYAFCDLVRAGLAWLELNKEHVNKLNVFPVPDGDTGTNMVLTMQSAVKRMDGAPEAHVGRVAQLLARGALMGARGNSGVILSQIWRGFARTVSDMESFDAATFADGMREAADTAYKGVMKPVEGTILTIVRTAADAAQEAVADDADLNGTLAHILDRCQVALAETPEQLPILKQAGVVDSGGQGFVYLLEGMMRWQRDELAPQLLQSQNGRAVATAQELARPDDGQLEFPYDVQFILHGRDLDVEQIRQAIDRMGDSTVVVGDETTIKVHIHVKNPGQPISYGAALGIVDDVVVEHMQTQMETIIAGGAPADRIHMAAAAIEPGQIGIVAVAPGPGIREAFQRLGAHQVIDGGQTNNPSTEEIYQALQDVATDRIIVLPNNKNIFLAAAAAADLSPKQVVVVPTRTVAQGVAALMGYASDGDLEEIAAAMEEIIADVVTGEVTTSVRDVQLGGLAVAVGQIIGLVDGQMCAAGDQLSDVVEQTLAGMGLEEREILTIFYGEQAEAATVEVISRRVADLYPDIEIETIFGGQPHYFFIFGAE